jgi:hypothetical protein
VPNPVSVCCIGIGLAAGPGFPELLMIVWLFGAVVSHPRLQIWPRSPSFQILTSSDPTSPIELDIDSGRLVFLLLPVESLLVLDLFAVIAAVIAGVLLRWA